MNGVLLLGPGLQARFGELLDDLYMGAHALDVVASIDDIAAAILELRQRIGPGGIGAIAIGPAATLLLEAATVLPQLDALVLFDLRLPATTRPHYARMRAQLQIHRATDGNALTADDLARLREETAPGHVQIFDWDYATANDRFIVEPHGDDDAAHSEIAWDRTRDFLTTALPSA